LTNARIVEAIVNGIVQWRVYVNMELVQTFTVYEDAVQYLESLGN